MTKEKKLEYLIDKEIVKYPLDIEKAATYHPSSSMEASSEYLINKFKMMSKDYKYAYSCTQALKKHTISNGWVNYETKRHKLIKTLINGKEVTERVALKKDDYLRKNIWFFSNLKPDIEIFVNTEEQCVDLQPNYSNKAKLMLCLDDMRTTGINQDILKTLEDMILSSFDFNDTSRVTKEDNMYVLWDTFAGEEEPNQWHKSLYHWYKQRVLVKFPYLTENVGTNPNIDKKIDEEIEEHMKLLYEEDVELKKFFTINDFKEPEYRIDIDTQYIENLKMRYILYDIAYNKEKKFIEEYDETVLLDVHFYKRNEYDIDAAIEEFLNKTKRTKVEDAFWLDIEKEYDELIHQYKNHMSLVDQIEELKNTPTNELYFKEREFINRNMLAFNTENIFYKMPNLLKYTSYVQELFPVSEYNHEYKLLFKMYRDRYSRFKTQKIMKKYKTLINKLIDFFMIEYSQTAYSYISYDFKTIIKLNEEENEFLEFLNRIFKYKVDKFIENWRDYIVSDLDDIYYFFEENLADMEKGSLTVKEQIECVLSTIPYHEHENY